MLPFKLFERSCLLPSTGRRVLAVARLISFYIPIRQLETPAAKKGSKLRRAPGQKPNPDMAARMLRESISSAAGSNVNGLISKLRPVTSITVGEEINLKALLLHPENLQTQHYEEVVSDEVLLTRLDGKELMILSNGSLVGWNILETDMINRVLPAIKHAITQPFEIESEEMDYLLVLQSDAAPQASSFLRGELFMLQSGSNEKRILDMAAFAIGFSRSTRLSVLENALEKHILLTKENSMKLASGQKITASEKDVLRLTGRLFLLRGRLNLYSELIETPDLYWSEPNLEKIYNAVSRILDINSRIAIMNRKLDYATDEQRAFLSVLTEKKSTRLEWVIIILIMVEVTFEIHHFVEKRDSKERDRNSKVCN